MRRFNEHFAISPSRAQGLQPGHPALVEARTIFPSTVVSIAETPRVLISGHNQRKMGKTVTKGRWAGMPIFCLTLEERATCPSTCHHWEDCYGNGMPFARRHRHGDELEQRLAVELAQLQAKYQSGFIVRLHILGDFYDAAYVFLWRRWADRFPALRIFGYTAHDVRSPMGKLIETLNGDYQDRIYIRFSRKYPAMRNISAITIPDANYPTDAIICPAQTGSTDCCGTCGLCWSTDKTIAFLQHGGLGRGRKEAA